MKKEKISAYQYFWLSTNMLISTIILLIPKIIIQDGREYAWIVPIVAGSAIAIINYLVLILGCNFSNNIIISDLKNILGPILGRILLIPYIFIIIHTTSMMMYQGVQFASFVMPSKAEIGFWIMIALLGSYLSYKGLETIARLAQIGVLIISIAVITILIGSYNSITIKWLKPFAINYKKIIRASITPAHWFLIIPNLSLILKPYFKNNKKSIKASLLGNFMGQFITVILFINALTVLGADLTSILKFPFYTLSSLALAGLEVIIFIAWIMGVIIEVGIFYFSSLQLISSFFELKDYRILIPPFLIMITSLGIFQTNIPMSLTKIGYIVPINVLLLEIPFLIIFTLIYLAASRTDKLSKQ